MRLWDDFLAGQPVDKHALSEGFGKTGLLDLAAYAMLDRYVDCWHLGPRAGQIVLRPERREVVEHAFAPLLKQAGVGGGVTWRKVKVVDLADLVARHTPLQRALGDSHAALVQAFGLPYGVAEWDTGFADCNWWWEDGRVVVQPAGWTESYDVGHPDVDNLRRVGGYVAAVVWFDNVATGYVLRADKENQP